MLWILCLLVAALTRGDAAKVLTLTPAVLTVPVGQKVVLNCNITRDDINQSVTFYRQFPGDAPQYILNDYHSWSKFYINTEDFPLGKFGVGGSSDVDYQFIIKQAKAEDSAEYYCSTWDTSRTGVMLFGGGTKLLVTSPDATPPMVTVFPPSNDELQSKEATLVCVATLSTPNATVTWQASGSLATGTIATGPATREATGNYKISSYLTVQTSEWSSDIPYTCKVSSGLQSAQNTIKKSKCAT
ncbi:immunoglobulin lambda-1 light chain-like [Corythoichthys intestinalis]|uniref:immunoglobulin lambda-1 light chain-like n=1 Tax=Corythoichthys intestinalis TaxID=161448 RepID=UPI0025A60E68|nr:immunoglobulin lambda-1 light chain-like [Corythoichthys intestinalis]